MKEQVQKVNIQDYNLGRNKRKLIENLKFLLWLLRRTRAYHVVASGGGEDLNAKNETLFMTQVIFNLEKSTGFRLRRGFFLGLFMHQSFRQSHVCHRWSLTLKWTTSLSSKTCNTCSALTLWKHLDPSTSKLTHLPKSTRCLTPSLTKKVFPKHQ